MRGFAEAADDRYREILAEVEAGDPPAGLFPADLIQRD